MEEAGFIQSVRERPHDEALRLIYADWLEERRDARAEFLRRECDLRKMNNREPGFQAALARWLDQRDGLPPGWLDSLGNRVAGLPLPQDLVDALATGRWGGARPKKYLLPSGLRYLTMDGDFDTFSEELMRRETLNVCYELAWLGKSDTDHTPGDIDPRLTVLIGDLGVSSEEPFALDYRASLEQPKVLLFRWQEAPGPYDVRRGDIGQRWIEVAPNFLTFWQQLGSCLD